MNSSLQNLARYWTRCHSRSTCIPYFLRHFIADYCIFLLSQLGNLTNPHWQSEKKLDFADFKDMGIKGVIASWVHTSDENAALQFLPNAGAPGDGNLFDVPALYVGNSTGETIRNLLHEDKVDTATIVLDAPSYMASSRTLVGRLEGLQNSSDSILLYTHSGFLA